jgi:hypothetical protein
MFRNPFQSPTTDFRYYPTLSNITLEPAEYGTAAQSYRSLEGTGHGLPFLNQTESQQTEDSAHAFQNWRFGHRTELESFIWRGDEPYGSLNNAIMQSGVFHPSYAVERPHNEPPKTAERMSDSFVDFLGEGDEYGGERDEAFIDDGNLRRTYPHKEMRVGCSTYNDPIGKVDNSSPETLKSFSFSSHGGPNVTLPRESPTLQQPPDPLSSNDHGLHLVTNSNGISGSMRSPFAIDNQEVIDGLSATQSHKPNLEDRIALSALVIDHQEELKCCPVQSFEDKPSETHPFSGDVALKGDNSFPWQALHETASQGPEEPSGIFSAYELEHGSLFSCVSTVACFGYDESPHDMVAADMINVRATGQMLFDVTLQRYSVGNLEGVSTSLRGVDIPQGCQSLESLHDLLELRFTDFYRYPEYYGFSCVLGAYTRNAQASYDRIVAEVCKCLYEALICQ